MQPLNLPFRAPAPKFSLVGANGETVSLQDYRDRQRNLLLIMLHGPRCPHCAEIARGLAAHRQDWERWDTELLALHTDEEAFPDPALRQARDAGGQVKQRYDAAGADVVIAALEHRGQFMDGWHLRHPEPVDWRELAETARWLAIQEPECSSCEIAPGWQEA